MGNWMRGGRAGLGPEADEVMSTSFLAYDLFAGILCLVGVYVAGSLVHSWNEMVPNRFLVIAAWIGSAVLVLRGAAGVIQIGYWAVSDTGDAWGPMALYEPWFLAGGILFGGLAWFYGRGPVA